MVSTLDFESSDPSSNLGRTSFLYQLSNALPFPVDAPDILNAVRFCCSSANGPKFQSHPVHFTFFQPFTLVHFHCLVVTQPEKDKLPLRIFTANFLNVNVCLDTAYILQLASCYVSHKLLTLAFVRPFILKRETNPYLLLVFCSFIYIHLSLSAGQIEVAQIIQRVTSVAGSMV